MHACAQTISSVQFEFFSLPKPKKTKSIRSNKVMPKHLQNLQEFLPDLYMRSIVEAAIGRCHFFV